MVENETMTLNFLSFKFCVLSLSFLLPPKQQPSYMFYHLCLIRSTSGKNLWASVVHVVEVSAIELASFIAGNRLLGNWMSKG